VIAPGDGDPAMPQRSIDDPDLPLSSLLERWPETGEVFLTEKMLCFGCPIAPFHTVIDACLEYCLDEDEFRARLRRAALAKGR
jgi:hybrid cluster-associated redox disulfide protein